MHVKDAQRELREVYFGGALGPLIAGFIWIVSTVISKDAVARVGDPTLGIWALVIGGALIFPIGLLILKAAGRPTTTSHENPLNALAMQIAFTIPAAYPVIFAATYGHPAWFYPAMAVIVGAHYLPFIFLYGMPIYGAIALVLIGGATWIGVMCRDHFDYGGWFAGAVLLLSSPAVYFTWRRMHRAELTDRAA